MVVVARSLDSNVFVVAERPDEPDQQARILNIADKKLYPEQHLQAILKWGYWELDTLPAEELKKHLAAAVEVDFKGQLK